MSTLAPPQSRSGASDNTDDASSTPHLWRTVLLSFAPGDSPRLARLIGVFPTALILLVQAVTTLRLHNVANSDEALYIDAGHAYFEQWAGGPSAPDYGSYFSGHPYAYPVVGAPRAPHRGPGGTRAHDGPRWSAWRPRAS